MPTRRRAGARADPAWSPAAPAAAWAREYADGQLATQATATGGDILTIDPATRAVDVLPGAPAVLEFGGLPSPESTWSTSASAAAPCSTPSSHASSATPSARVTRTRRCWSSPRSRASSTRTRRAPARWTRQVWPRDSSASAPRVTRPRVTPHDAETPGSFKNGDEFDASVGSARSEAANEGDG